MLRTSKLFVFRPWVEPSDSTKTNGDKLPLVSSHDGDAAEQRNTNIKLAWFFSVVALFFVVVNHLGRVNNGTYANLGQDSFNGTSHGKLWDDVIRRPERLVVMSRS